MVGTKAATTTSRIAINLVTIHCCNTRQTYSHDMILAFFLLFVNDLFVLIADGADVDIWRCENDSASELLQKIWEENRNLSMLFLDLDPETASNHFLNSFVFY